jgi:hypothetical protein
MEEKIKKGIDLLDKFIPKALEFSKSLTSITKMMHVNHQDDVVAKYFKDKMKHHDMDFAGFYCNQGDRYRKICFKIFGVEYDKGELPEDYSEATQLRYKYIFAKRDKWEYESFELQLIQQYCLLAYNRNPESFFRDEIKNQALSEYFTQSKIQNYGNFKNWSNFWLYLMKTKAENEKKEIVKFILTERI